MTIIEIIKGILEVLGMVQVAELLKWFEEKLVKK